MNDVQIRQERARNLWESFKRKHEAFARTVDFDPAPELDFAHVGGLEAPKEELLTYACAATNPEVYQQWGTQPPSGLLLFGAPGTGKGLLARALAQRTGGVFLRISVPRLVIQLVHGMQAGVLIAEWPGLLEQLPATTVFFDELAFTHAEEIGAPRPELPVGPMIDFLLALVDRTAEAESVLMLASTSVPDTLRRGFVAPGRFERVVEVTPVFPGDLVAALELHAADAEKRAGRPLFDAVQWQEVVSRYRELSPGQWVRLLHAVLRRKARCQAAQEPSRPVTTEDLVEEVDRMRRTHTRLPASAGGNYI